MSVWKKGPSEGGEGERVSMNGGREGLNGAPARKLTKPLQASTQAREILLRVEKKELWCYVVLTRRGEQTPSTFRWEVRTCVACRRYGDSFNVGVAGFGSGFPERQGGAAIYGVEASKQRLIN